MGRPRPHSFSCWRSSSVVVGGRNLISCLFSVAQSSTSHDFLPWSRVLQIAPSCLPSAIQSHRIEPQLNAEGAESSFSSLLLTQVLTPQSDTFRLYSWGALVLFVLADEQYPTARCIGGFIFSNWACEDIRTNDKLKWRYMSTNLLAIFSRQYFSSSKRIMTKWQNSNLAGKIQIYHSSGNDILEWWKTHENILPILSQFARSYILHYTSFKCFFKGSFQPRENV